MRRFASGLYLVLHGLAHARLGMTAQDVSRGMASALPAGWRVALATTLFVGSMPVFVAAGLGVWGVFGLRGQWRRLTSLGVVSSSLLIAAFGVGFVYPVVGLWCDAIALAIGGALVRPDSTAGRVA